jgi:metal-responsive CopG/Arc/MetJ family transcriptional regulator
MAQSSPIGGARLQIVVPPELKEKLRRMAAGKGKKISVLVRESIEEKVRQLEWEVYEEKMRIAYLEMADENLGIAEDFEHSDAENV